MTSAGREQGPRPGAGPAGSHATDESATRVSELEARLAALESAARGRDEFIAFLAHELRSPLTPMSTAVQMLREEPMSERARRFVEVIARNLDSQTQLIDELAELSRVQARRLTLDPVSVDLGGILDFAAAAVAGAAERRRVELRRADPGVSVPVTADRGRLGQALEHLLSNAVKFSREGGVVDVALEATASTARVQIADRGCGIAPERLPTLFDPFLPAGGRRTRGGLGIGLALARGIVEAHGGTLTLESPGVDRGTTAVVSLPVAPAGAEAPAAAVGAPVRVLLVDDHEDSIALTRMMLERRGYAVVTARSVKDALTRAAEQPFDVLVTDIGLPDDSGLTILPELSKRGPIVGIAVSGFGRESDIARSKETGYVEHLTKPVSIHRLHELIARHLGRRRTP